MTKIVLLLLTIMIANADEIKISHAQLKTFGESIEVNAKIIQLSDQKQQIVSRLGGHLEQYFVQTGTKVDKGDKIAEIESLELSKMSATFIALKKEFSIAKEKVFNTHKLYKKGLVSRQELNTQQMSLTNIESKKNSLKSQLSSLNIDVKSLKKATDTFTIFAHADGKIEQLLANLHTNLNAQTPIVSLVQESGYYAEAYLPVDVALKMDKEIQATLILADKHYPCKFISLLPQVDHETGQAKILFWIESAQDMLLLNAYTKMQINTKGKEEFVAIKKSALTLFQGEWVVFVPNEEHHEEENEHAHEEHHEEASEHEHEHDGDEEELPYAAKVVEQLYTLEDFVAVKGIHADEAYVSDGVYFVKSLMLKSRLGGHGH